jgi:hypothetical protein
MQQFKPLCCHGGLKGSETSDVTTGMIQALNKPNLDRIGPERKDDWDGRSRRLQLPSSSIRYSNDV